MAGGKAAPGSSDLHPRLGLGEVACSQTASFSSPATLQINKTSSLDSGFLLDSLLEWKMLVCGVLTFQNALFHFKGLNVKRN